jgi:hypothetical protein
VRRTGASRTVKLSCAGCMTAILGIVVAQVPDQYPKPLVHTPTDHPAARVILLSVDGLHAVDLANWVAGHPMSTLAELSKRGVTYTNARSTVAAPTAGLISLATGGTPISTGIVSDNGFDRTLGPADSACVKLGSSIQLNGQMDAASGSSLDSLRFPRDTVHGCSPVSPHALVRVNTIFEVVHTKIGLTAWFGENATVSDMLKGPSGLGLDDSCGINRAATGGDSLSAVHDGDEAGVASVIHWIDGSDCTGKRDLHVPALFGMSFVSIAAAQAAPDMGYVDAAGTPSVGLAKSVAYVDDAIGRIVKELKKSELYDSTWIFVTSPYGQSPMDRRRVHHIPLDMVQDAAESVKPGLVAHVSGGDVAMIWLNDSAKTDTVVKALGNRANTLGIQDIYSGARLALTLRSPMKDSRMPDIILQPELGVLWGKAFDAALAGFGGMSDEDTHVALMVSGSQLTGRSDPTWVPTTQLAPLLLRALGMEKFDLDALHQEHTPALPGIF